MNRNIRFGRVLLSLVVGLTCGLVAVAQSEAQEREQLPRGKDTNLVPVKDKGGDRAGLITTDMNAPLTAAQLVETLLNIPPIPPGVTIANETFNGVTRAGGTFTGGGAVVGFPHGVIVSSGNIQSAECTGGASGSCNTRSSISTNNSQPNCAGLDAIAPPGNTQDRACLNFEITSVPRRIIGCTYAFVSDEYNEWVGSGYNDAAAVFVTTPPGVLPRVNHALVPAPVTVNTVNCGNPYGTGANFIYVNNQCGVGGLPGFACAAPIRDTEMDGLGQINSLGCWTSPAVPPVLPFRTTPIVLNSGQTYKVAVVVADNSDRIYDSNLLIKCTLDGGYCCVCDEVCACIDGTTYEDCEDLGGFWGGGLLCGEGPCGGIGACCYPDGSCEEGMLIEECFAAGGQFAGDGTVCTPTEACCFPDESCQDLMPFCCLVAGGVPQGEGTTCAGVDCTIYGACCYPDESCEVMTESSCSAAGGEYQGDGTFCFEGSCVPKIIPAVSEWGMLVLALFLLTGVTIAYNRRRRAAA